MHVLIETMVFNSNGHHFERLARLQKTGVVSGEVLEVVAEVQDVLNHRGNQTVSDRIRDGARLRQPDVSDPNTQAIHVEKSHVFGQRPDRDIGRVRDNA